MQKFLHSLFAALLTLGACTLANAADAPAKAEPDINQRVADLEAYMNNVGRGADAADAKVTSKIGAPAPATTPG